MTIKNLVIKQLTVRSESVEWGEVYRVVVIDEADNKWRTLETFDQEEAKKICTGAMPELFWGMNQDGRPDGFRFKLDTDYYTEYRVIPTRKFKLSEAELIANRILAEVSPNNQDLYDYCQHLAWNPYEKRAMWVWSSELDPQQGLKMSDKLDDAIIQLALALWEWRDEGRNKAPRKKVSEIKGLDSTLAYVETSLAAACAEFTLEVLNRLYIERDKFYVDRSDTPW